MSRFSAITDKPHDGRFNKKTGIFILRSPDALLPRHLEHIYASFYRTLNGQIPRFIWMIILYCFVLTLRPKRSAALYKNIRLKTAHRSRILPESKATGSPFKDNDTTTLTWLWPCVTEPFN